MAGWPWLLRAIWNPIEALDLQDKHDRPDHSKVLPWILLMVAMAFHALGMPFTWWELTTLGSLAFGYGAWRQFLASKSVSGTFDTKKIETLTHTINETGASRRDAAEGVEPTHN